MIDYPPERGLEDTLAEGPIAGKKLDKEKYNGLLTAFYEKRGWDSKGIPTRATMIKLGLEKEAKQRASVVKFN